MRKAITATLAGSLAVAMSVGAANAAVTFGIKNSSTQGVGNQANVFAPELTFGTDWGTGVTSSTLSVVGPGSDGGQFRSPWQNTVDDATGTYFSVGGDIGSPQTIEFDAAVTGITMLIGSIDDYNSFTFNGTDVISGSDILAALGDPDDTSNPELVALVRFKGPISKIEFSSTSAALEFAVAAVPLPAGVILLGLGLAGLGGARVMQKRRKDA